MKKFWNWKNRTVTNEETQEQIQERTLFLNGTIAEESWFDDEITPQLFKDELMSGAGNITVWINSPGGDCVAAAQIYNMLMDYHGDVTVKIDGIAASAASVIAMAGTKVLMSPTALMMIHNPLTVAIGDSEEMQKAIDMLSEVKESIINAYEIKTGLSRAKLSHLMEMYHVHRLAVDPAFRLGQQGVYLGRILLHRLRQVTAGNKPPDILQVHAMVMKVVLMLLASVYKHFIVQAPYTAFLRRLKAQLQARQLHATQPLHYSLRLRQQLEKGGGQHIAGSPHGKVKIQGFHFSLPSGAAQGQGAVP